MLDIYLQLLNVNPLYLTGRVVTKWQQCQLWASNLTVTTNRACWRMFIISTD